MSSSEKSPAQKLAELLADQCPDALIAQALQACLTATQTTRAGTVEADNRIRLEAARLVLAYRHGTPIQRSETIAVSVDADSATGMEQRLAHSPALRAIFRKMLEKVENAEAIDVG